MATQSSKDKEANLDKISPKNKATRLLLSRIKNQTRISVLNQNRLAKIVEEDPSQLDAFIGIDTNQSWDAGGQKSSVILDLCMKYRPDLLDEYYKTVIPYGIYAISTGLDLRHFQSMDVMVAAGRAMSRIENKTEMEVETIIDSIMGRAILFSLTYDIEIAAQTMKALEIVFPKEVNLHKKNRIGIIWIGDVSGSLNAKITQPEKARDVLMSLIAMGVKIDTPQCYEDSINTPQANRIKVPNLLSYACLKSLNRGKGHDLVEILIECGANWKELLNNNNTLDKIKDYLIKSPTVKRHLLEHHLHEYKKKECSTKEGEKSNSKKPKM